jgi:hypothetical protein
MTYVVILAFVAIVGSLVVAMLLMLRGGKSESTQAPPSSRGMAKALAVRVGLSILLFAFILLSYWMGWIQPTGIAPGR